MLVVITSASDKRFGFVERDEKRLEANTAGGRKHEVTRPSFTRPWTLSTTVCALYLLLYVALFHRLSVLID
jgi:hypothetical protein